jgi:multiple sugar transport system substrate-binding protein
MLRRRVVLAWVLVLALSVTALAGCGSSKPADTNQDGEKGSGSPAKAPVTIVWSYWGDPWEAELNQKVKEAFEAKHQNIKIETQHTPWANYFDKIQTQWAGGTSPDVMFLNNIPLYASKNVLMDLNPLIKQHQFDLTDYPTALLESWKSEDGTKLWGAPRDNDTKVFFYNKKLFDEANVPHPTQDWTWEDLRSAANKLTKRDGNTVTQYGVAFETAFWRLYVWQNGAQLFDNDRTPTKSPLDDPKAVEAVQFLSDLINKDKVTPPYDQLKGSSNIAALFETGRLGMAWGNAALIPTFSKISGFEWDVVNMPKANTGTPFMGYLGGAGYTISNKTEHPDEAFTFWSFLSSGEAQQIFASSGLVVPATKSGMASDAFAKDKPYNVDAFVYATSIGRGNPLWTNWPQAHRVMDAEIQKALVGQINAAEAVKSAAAAGNEYIKNPR